jgi:F0F1-type ATP synthase epsilon subunit
VDQAGLVQQAQAVQELLGEDAHQGSAEAAELVLLDELVQIDTQQLQHETEVLAVDEGVFETQQMVVVVLVVFGVELRRGQRSAIGRGKAEHEADWMWNSLTRSRTETSIMLWLK